MTPAQLAAYENLCAKVPEAASPIVQKRWEGPAVKNDCGEWQIVNWDTALAILTAHLEAMLPPGCVHRFPHPEIGLDEHGYDFDEICKPSASDPDRFIALCRAVEASR